MAVSSNVVEKALEAAHVKSDPDETLQDREVVRGYDFDKGIDHHKLLKSFMNNGFQATHFARAVNEVNTMVIIANLLRAKKRSSFAD